MVVVLDVGKFMTIYFFWVNLSNCWPTDYVCIVPKVDLGFVNSIWTCIMSSYLLTPENKKKGLHCNYPRLCEPDKVLDVTTVIKFCC